MDFGCPLLLNFRRLKDVIDLLLKLLNLGGSHQAIIHISPHRLFLLIHNDLLSQCEHLLLLVVVVVFEKLNVFLDLAVDVVLFHAEFFLNMLAFVIVLFVVLRLLYFHFAFDLFFSILELLLLLFQDPLFGLLAYVD